jgi:pyruvate/2-oxoglutarate dehydrogenase complex dihydrolipoamide dehydrogenase (E3) component
MGRAGGRITEHHAGPLGRKKRGSWGVNLRQGGVNFSQAIRAAGIDLLEGTAALTAPPPGRRAPLRLAVTLRNGTVASVAARRVLVATGASPAPPRIKGSPPPPEWLQRAFSARRLTAQAVVR